MGFGSLLYCGYYISKGNFWMGGIIMWIFFVLVIGAGILLFVSLYKKNNVVKSESPLDVLKKRYASGEIDKKEFDKIKNYLV